MFTFVPEVVWELFVLNGTNQIKIVEDIIVDEFVDEPPRIAHLLSLFTQHQNPPKFDIRISQSIIVGMNMNTTSKRRASRVVKSLRVIVNDKEKKMAEGELGKSIKELERERRIQREANGMRNGYLLPGAT